MSTKNTQPDPLTPRQVTMVFEEIVSTSLALDGILSALETEGFLCDSDRAGLTSAAVMINKRIGLVADLYSRRCGEMLPILGVDDVDRWLMPTSFLQPMGE